MHVLSILTRFSVSAHTANHAYIGSCKAFSLSRTLQPDVFPLQKPSWTVKKLLAKPESIVHSQELDSELHQKEIRRLFDLSGLNMHGLAQDKHRYEQICQEINQLRDLLSHIQVVSESEDLSKVPPLVRIAEPISFTTESPTADLDFTRDREAELGRGILKTASQTSGDYLVVEE